MNELNIRKADNGYILNDGLKEEVYINTQDLFKSLLQKLLGVSEYFSGTMFGEVKINLDETVRLKLEENRK